MAKVPRFRLTTPKPPKLSENDVRAACLDFLRLRGYYPIRLQSGLFKTPDGRWIKLGEIGIPDYVAIHAKYPGFFLETKRTGGALRPEQEQKNMELKMGYRLAVTTADSVEALGQWLALHERQ